MRGRFAVEVGKKAKVTLDTGLVDDPRVRRVPNGLAFSASAAEVVEASQPITLQGQLDTGEIVTLLDASNYGGDGRFGFPQYQTYTVVVGALVDGATQHYGALRVRFDDPNWLAHLVDGESRVVEDDGSKLGVEVSDEGNWLVYESALPQTLRELQARAEMSCLTLARLVLDQNVITGARQVRVDPADPWLTVWGSARYAASEAGDTDTLLPREELTLARFAKWIALNDRLDGLASAVAEPLTGVLQVQAQVASSLVEGLHRRLPSYKQSHFRPEDKAALKRVRNAAAGAAATQAKTEGLDHALVRKLVTDALGHIGQVSFGDRATDVVTEVCCAVPEIVESLADLPGQLKAARNDMAHHLQLDEQKEPLLQRYRRYLVITTMTPWLLRGLLLLRAGIEPDALHDGYISHQRFEFARANVTQFVAELGWQQPTREPCPRCVTRSSG